GAMAARLGALRDQNVGARFERLSRHALVLHLADQQRSRGLDSRRKRPGVAEREHDRTRPDGECDIQEFWLLRQAPGDEADAERRPAGFQLDGFLLEPGFVAIAAAEDAEAAGLANRRNQARA